MAFVPESFVVPTSFAGEGFRLEPLSPAHNEQDFAAWHGSVKHIQSTPGFVGGSWPVGAYTLKQNLADLVQHEKDFAARSGFTYSVLSPSSEVIGCVYLYPSKREAYDVNPRSWVRADDAHLDKPLYEAVLGWITSEWPFKSVDYAPR